MQYLRHIISEGEVRMDANKVVAIEEWPKPTTVSRGFSGLAR